MNVYRAIGQQNGRLFAAAGRASTLAHTPYCQPELRAARPHHPPHRLQRGRGNLNGSQRWLQAYAAAPVVPTLPASKASAGPVSAVKHAKPIRLPPVQIIPLTNDTFKLRFELDGGELREYVVKKDSSLRLKKVRHAGPGLPYICVHLWGTCASRSHARSS